MTTSNETRIRRHSPFIAAVRTPLSAIWIGIRFLLLPVLWLRYRMGSRMNWAFATDACMKRLLYPLTEGADETPRRDVEVPPALLAPPSPGAANGWARVSPHPVDLERFANGRPLLLILYRGSWCPYSRLHLTDLATVAQRLDELGVAVLAVSARNHAKWWHARGIALDFAADPDGDLFRAMGVRIEPPLAHRVWGMLLPHESVFLFDRNGNLVAADVRRLSATKTRQTFLSSTRWLTIAHALTDAERIAQPDLT